MSTLFLTSAGIKVPAIETEFLKILPKNPQEIQLIHITTASNVAAEKAFVDRDREVMKRLGFKVTELDITGKTEAELRQALQPADVIYVQGGNGFYLLKQVKLSGFEQVVKELITKGVIYVGASAGTYIACPTIEMHTWMRDVDDMFGLDDLIGMRLVPFLITAHFNRVKYRELLAEKISTASLPVRILTDDQALLVQDGEVKLVGVGEEVKI